jgi:hypothetical protein
LHFASSKFFEIAHRVLVFKLAIYDITPDEKFRVRVRAKASAFLYSVFVDDAQWAKRLVLGVVV